MASPASAVAGIAEREYVGFAAHTISQKGTSVLHMGDVVSITETTVRAELLGWIRAAFLDGLGLGAPVLINYCCGG